MSDLHATPEERDASFFSKASKFYSKLDPPAAKPAHTAKVLYSEQCRAFADNSIERCAKCLNHPDEHSFPVTAQRDALLAACKALVDVSERIGPPDIQMGTLSEENDWTYGMRTARAAIASSIEGKQTSECVCYEINMRHCPVHGHARAAIASAERGKQ
jgi:hypothetical protein